MSLDMKIKKHLGNFTLDMELSAENDVLALLGASGCGKSMTLRCIAGIETPDEGYIRVNGRTLFSSDQKINLSPQQRHVGLLFQNYALFPNMSVEQNIIMGMNGFKLTKSEKKELCGQMLSRFYLEGLQKHKPSQLSGGQQQRVALARIMVSKPGILMLDEPFSALDSFLRWELEQELMRVLEDFEGTTLIVSHNRDEVYRISDNIAVVSNGRVDSFGDKKQIFTNPDTYQSALLTGCRNFSRVEYIDDSHLYSYDWDTKIRVKNVHAGIRYIALKPGFMRILDREAENTARFKVIKSIDNFNEQILILEAANAVDTAEQNIYKVLNIRVEKNEWRPFKNLEYIYLDLIEDNLLLLTD